ncbi:MAG TPA: energy transducer TonB [Pyrinomonadaceae bacterium]|nr:energy transducer TonB [Pyrinomonadaceae bacterium]
MKAIRFNTAALSFLKILSGIIFLSASTSSVQGQATVEAAATPNAVAPAPNAAAASVEAVRTRLTHARALAATGNFTAAVSELETARREAHDDSVRDVARVLLMSVHLKLSNYTRSRELLEEAFAGRAAKQPNTTQVYFALVGQMLNGVRSRLDRYREFGLSTADATLPVEAHNDLGHIRLILERLVEQAKLIRAENVTNTDSAALLEDAASVRLMLARNDEERTQWQNEVAEARQSLAASDTRIVSNSPRNTAPPAASTPSAAAEKAVDAAPANVPTNTSAITNPPAASPPVATPERTADSPAANNTTTSSSSPTAPSTPPPARPAPQSNTTSNNNATTNNNAAAAAAPISVGSLHDKATQRVSPTYPPTARTARVSGMVTVYLLVDEKGAVQSVQRASGPAQLQQSATDAARRWKFRPTLIDGQPVRVSGYLSFSFTL